MANKALVVDANILIGAVLRKRTRELMEAHCEDISGNSLPRGRRTSDQSCVGAGGDPDKALTLLRALTGLMELISRETYDHFEAEARTRLDSRDAEDWPILVAALALRCPIWTEDNDFFGCGAATWTWNRIEFFRS